MSIKHTILQDPKALILPVMALVCLLPVVGAGAAVGLGILVAVVFGNPFQTQTRHLTKRLLSISIIGLGAGMNLITVAKAGAAGIGYTAASIALSIAAGLLIGRVFRCEKESSLLITIGTAICGGSAIAAIAPVINAKGHNISVALAVVFVLNAVALFLFPPIGHWMHLTQHQFGLWSALAIHDTSSVVGAGTVYGKEALMVGTTVKLARALWIVPLTLALQYVHNKRNNQYIENKENISAYAEKVQHKRPSYPWFILGFLGMAAAVTFVPALAPAGAVIETVAKRLLVMTLFLIGTNMTVEAIREVGIKPLLQGVTLWLLVAGVSLGAIVVSGQN